MVESILSSIKGMLGIPEDCEDFDNDIITHINTTFMTLSQLGVGLPDGFTIKDKTTVWNDYIKSDKNLESIKTYMYLNVRLLFDPPASSVAIETIEKQIDQLTWRIYIMVDPSSNN